MHPDRFLSRASSPLQAARACVPQTLTDALRPLFRACSPLQAAHACVPQTLTDAPRPLFRACSPLQAAHVWRPQVPILCPARPVLRVIPSEGAFQPASFPAAQAHNHSTEIFPPKNTDLQHVSVGFLLQAQECSLFRNI